MAPVFLAVVFLAATLGIAGCGTPVVRPRDPIVLLTLSAVRADVTGPAARHSLTPHLDAFAAGADWAGTAVAASSDPLVSLASLLTGVSPWQHQLLTSEDPRLRDLPTLAQVLHDAGYRTTAIAPAHLRELFARGFDRWLEPPPAPDAAAALTDLAAGDFLWIHLDDADIGSPRRRPGKRRLNRRQLLLFADPESPLPEDKRRRLWAEYRRHLAHADRHLGDLLAALDHHPLRDRATVAITATQGLELGEHGQILYGENLGRESIEVPLVLKLSTDASPLAEPPGRIAQTRLWTTLAAVGTAPAEAAAGEATPVQPVRLPPVHLPGLDRVDAAPILSELYCRNGINRFSLLEGDLQLIWTAHFAPPEPEYFLARWARAGGRGAHLAEPPARLFARILDVFAATPPLAGEPLEPPTLALERWTPRGSETVADGPAERRLAADLEGRWRRFTGRERPPAAERGPPAGTSAVGIY